MKNRNSRQLAKARLRTAPYLSLFSIVSILLLVGGCGLGGNESDPGNSRSTAGSSTPTPTPIGDIQGGQGNKRRAYRISGNIDDARQEGNVCDTSVEFTVPGTLKFKFTPETPTKGTYEYSGAFNAKGSGPYEIRDDGTMLVDGTGCIMGRCATYSHEWKATPIDAATCVAGR